MVCYLLSKLIFFNSVFTGESVMKNIFFWCFQWIFHSTSSRSIPKKQEIYDLYFWLRNHPFWRKHHIQGPNFYFVEFFIYSKSVFWSIFVTKFSLQIVAVLWRSCVRSSWKLCLMHVYCVRWAYRIQLFWKNYSIQFF
jgi:hypothetical protein